MKYKQQQIEILKTFKQLKNSKQKLKKTSA